MTKILYFKGMNIHIDKNRGVVIFTTQCPICQDMTGVEIPIDEYEKLTQEEIDNEPIQIIFPNMRPTQREIFISNLCPTCQNQIFEVYDDIDYDPFEDCDDIDYDSFDDEFDILTDDNDC